MQCKISDFLRAFGCTRDDVNNAYRRGVIEPGRVPKTTPARARPLDRRQALELAIALQLDRLGLRPSETRALLRNHLDGCARRKVRLLILADARVPIEASDLKEIAGALRDVTGLRLVNVEEINRRVDSMFGVKPTRMNEEKRR